MEEDSLANTVIQGGLEAPVACVPVQPQTNEDLYLDPLGRQPRDARTDLGRGEIPVPLQAATIPSDSGLPSTSS